MLPPICSAVPSRPAEPPKRCVTSVPNRTSGAIRRGTPAPGWWISSMSRLFPAGRGFPVMMIEPADAKPADRQQPQQPGIGKTHAGERVQAPQEKRRCRSDRHRHRHEHGQPFRGGKGLEGRRIIWRRESGRSIAEMAASNMATGAENLFASGPSCQHGTQGLQGSIRYPRDSAIKSQTPPRPPTTQSMRNRT